MNERDGVAVGIVKRMVRDPLVWLCVALIVNGVLILVTTGAAQIVFAATGMLSTVIALWALISDIRRLRRGGSSGQEEV